MHLMRQYPEIYDICGTMKKENEGLCVMITDLAKELRSRIIIFEQLKEWEIKDIAWKILKEGSLTIQKQDATKDGRKMFEVRVGGYSVAITESSEKANRLETEIESALSQMINSQKCRSLKDRFQEHSKLFINCKEKFDKEVDLLVRKLIDGTEKLKPEGCEVCGGKFSDDDKKELEELKGFLAPQWRPSIF